MELAQQKILLTGATGFIGGHLARRLVTEKGAAVRALVRDLAKAEELRMLGLEVAHGDLNVFSLPRAGRSGLCACRSRRRAGLLGTHAGGFRTDQCSRY